MRLLPALWAAAALLLAAASFFTGRALQSEQSSASAFDLQADAYEVTKGHAGLSKAGFSGFTESSAEGRTVISGRVVSLTAEAITIEGQGGQRSTLRLSGPGQLRRLEIASRDVIRPGLTVLVRHESGADVAEAVLVVLN